MRFIIRLVLSLLLLSVPVGCTTNKATGRSQLIFMSVEEEIQLGSEAQPVFLKDNGGEIPSPQILAYVRDIGARLAASSERPDLPWEFHVLDSKQINAFALPGGKVFFSRGLLERMSNEAQVAAVMGHEVGHVTAMHIGERMSQAMLTQGLIAGLGVAGEVSDNAWLQVLGAGGQVGGSLYLLKFGRDQESESDRLGMRYMVKNGYNPVGMMEVMQILKDASGGGGASGIEQMLSTHPDPANRLKDAEKLILKEYPDFQDTSKYTMGHQRFQQVVLANLKRLPPPRHQAMGPAMEKVSPALAKAMERRHEMGQCACHGETQPMLVLREAGAW